MTPGLAISSAPDQATDFLRAPAGTTPVRIGCFIALVLNNARYDRQDAPITRPNGYLVPRSEDEPAETALSRPGDRHQIDDAGQGAAGQGALVAVPGPRGDSIRERPLLPRCERPASAWACRQTPASDRPLASSGNSEERQFRTSPGLRCRLFLVVLAAGSGEEASLTAWLGASGRRAAGVTREGGRGRVALPPPGTRMSDRRPSDCPPSGLLSNSSTAEAGLRIRRAPAPGLGTTGRGDPGLAADQDRSP